MQRQGSVAEREYGAKMKQTRRDKFLAETEAVVPRRGWRSERALAGAASLDA
jgi:hypothetical protein